MADDPYDVIHRDSSWPNSPDIRDHDELHPVPGAVEANRGRTCPDCLALLWDRYRVPPEHTVEQCTWNQEWMDRQDARAGGRPITGVGAPDIMRMGF